MKYLDSQFSSNSSDSNFDLQRKRKSKSKKNHNFEKNFPKNILTSIIAALDHMGYQEIYLDGDISGQEIQRRNSASLKNIYRIITHPLLNAFNKHQFELLASNILFQNSKISKKAFHLLLLREVFSFSSSISLKQFKIQMRKRAKSNSLKNCQNLQIFRSQSSTIYLLTMLGKVIDGNPNLPYDSLESRQSTQEYQNIFLNDNNEQVKKERKNREILKPSIKDLSAKLNNMQWKQNKCQNIYDSIKNIILNTEEKIIQKLNLKHGVPYLRLFCSEVVSVCLKKIKNGQKITISNLEAFVKQYERKSLENISQSVSCIIFPIEKLLISRNEEKDSSQLSMQSKVKNSFSPIVLTRPY